VFTAIADQKQNNIQQNIDRLIRGAEQNKSKKPWGHGGKGDQGKA